MSELRAATISNLAGTGAATLTGQTAAKAWVKFNGTGTVAISASANTSSITDNGTGDYTENLTSATTDANYAVAGDASSLSSAGPILAPWSTAPTTTACRMLSCSTAFAATDHSHVSLVLVR